MERGVGIWRGGHLTSSPSVDQKEWEIRVTTRPGDEGVPRWSSLVWMVGLVLGWDGLGGDGDGIRGRVDGVEKEERENGPGLPEPTDVACYVTRYATIWGKGR